MSDPEELVALATAAGAAGLFAHGLGGVTLTKSARALGVPTEQLVVGFGSVRRLAACSFARHLEPVRTAIERRPAAGDHVSLTDGVYELVRCARADRHAALALLHERQLAHQGVDGGSRPDVMAAVPLDDLFVTPVATSTGATEASARELATLLVDTVLAQAATRRTATLADLTETALRLLPDRGAEDTRQNWAPARKTDQRSAGSTAKAPEELAQVRRQLLNFDRRSPVLPHHSGERLAPASGAVARSPPDISAWGPGRPARGPGRPTRRPAPRRTR